MYGSKQETRRVGRNRVVLLERVDAIKALRRMHRRLENGDVAV
jgi:hypothetical protein